MIVNDPQREKTFDADSGVEITVNAVSGPERLWNFILSEKDKKKISFWARQDAAFNKDGGLNIVYHVCLSLDFIGSPERKNYVDYIRKLLEGFSYYYGPPAAAKGISKCDVSFDAEFVAKIERWENAQ